MSAEFAQAENCPLPHGCPDRPERIAEIKDLDLRLGARKLLENINQAFRFTETYVFDPYSKPKYFLIKFDNYSKQLDVSVFFSSLPAVYEYDIEEYKDQDHSKNIVLVEADKIENLKEAYPNYFGDVQLFRMQLGKIIKGKEIEEYTVRPQETVAPRPNERPDLAWLKRRGQIKWEE